MDCDRRNCWRRIDLLKSGRGKPLGLVVIVVKVRLVMLREMREGAKPNGLMAAVLAIWTMDRGCRDGGGRECGCRYVGGLLGGELLRVLMDPERSRANKICRALELWRMTHP